MRASTGRPASFAALPRLAVFLANSHYASMKCSSITSPILSSAPGAPSALAGTILRYSSPPSPLVPPAFARREVEASRIAGQYMHAAFAVIVSSVRSPGGELTSVPLGGTFDFAKLRR